MLLYKQQQIKTINKRRKKDVRTFKIRKHKAQERKKRC